MPHGVGSPHSLMIQVWWSMLWGSSGVHSGSWSGVDGDPCRHEMPRTTKVDRIPAKHPRAERSARFVCVLYLAEPDGVIRHMVRGTMEGHITGTAWNNGWIRPTSDAARRPDQCRTALMKRTDDPIADKLVALWPWLWANQTAPRVDQSARAEARWRGPPPTHLTHRKPSPLLPFTLTDSVGTSSNLERFSRKTDRCWINRGVPAERSSTLPTFQPISGLKTASRKRSDEAPASGDRCPETASPNRPSPTHPVPRR